LVIRAKRVASLLPVLERVLAGSKYRFEMEEGVEKYSAIEFE
jgi:hypothetical protein